MSGGRAVREERGRLNFVFIRAWLERWTRAASDTMSTRLKEAETDMVTGAKFGPMRHGEPPEAAAGDLRQNALGPVRFREVGG